MMLIKAFEELDIYSLYQIINLRERVFIVEQKCYYLDTDNNDQKAWHLSIIKNDKLAGYLRILPPGVTYKYPSIGRVVIDKDFRGLQLGRTMMEEAISFLKAKFPDNPIKIGAQVYLNQFYKSLGFKNIGDEYLEDGIPHIDMLLE